MKRADEAASQAILMSMVQTAVTVAAAQDNSRTRRNYVNAVSRVACAVAENNPTGEALDAIKRMLDQMADAQRGA